MTAAADIEARAALDHSLDRVEPHRRRAVRRQGELLAALHTHGPEPITAEHLAERVDATPRTIYRDMRALTALGLPIHGEAGRGYTLDPDAPLPPVGLTLAQLVTADRAWVIASRDGAELGALRSALFGPLRPAVRRAVELIVRTMWRAGADR